MKLVLSEGISEFLLRKLVRRLSLFYRALRQEGVKLNEGVMVLLPGEPPCAA